MLRKKGFNEIEAFVKSEMETEQTYPVSSYAELKRKEVCHYSDNGLQGIALRTKFPASFVNELSHGTVEDVALGDEILNHQVNKYFDNNGKPLLFREFFGCVCGVLSDRYSVFDDDEVLSMIKDCPYLLDAEEIWASISPEHLHLRFISKNRLTIPNDDSELSMCVFIDNSMVGRSSLKVRFGIYRWACTNGMIAGLKEFTLLKERHFGEKNFTKMLSEVFSEVDKYEEMLLDIVKDMSVTKSHIYNMTEEDAVSYIKDKLNVGKKTAGKIIELYQNYGGTTKWDLCNAITDYAHNSESIDNRVRLETLAMKVA